MDDEAAHKWPAIMLDIETLGITDDAVILEIGAECFDPVTRERGPMFSRAVDPVAQRGRTIDAATLVWWHADAARRQTFGAYLVAKNARSLDMALAELADFFTVNVAEGAEVWTKGAFDLRLLDHAFAGGWSESPWHYWQARELRTVMKLAGLTKQPVAHSALEDAVVQVNELFRALNALRAPVEQAPAMPLTLLDPPVTGAETLTDGGAAE